MYQKDWREMVDEVNSFRRILVAVDGSEQSTKGLDVAISLAMKYNSSVTALYVAYVPFNETSDPNHTVYKQLLDDIDKQVRKWLVEIERKGLENNIKVETRIAETNKSIPYKIASYAESNKFDLIVIGSKGRSNIEKLYLGSVAFGVLTYASCPVLVVR
jgi:nucleotide-binding universal stress UspA family protein